MPKAGHIWYGQLVTELERQNDWCRIVSFTTTGIRIEGWVYAPNISMGAGPARRMAVVNNPTRRTGCTCAPSPRATPPRAANTTTARAWRLDGDIRNGWVEVCVGMARGYMEAKYLTLDPLPGGKAAGSGTSGGQQPQRAAAPAPRPQHNHGYVLGSVPQRHAGHGAGHRAGLVPCGDGYPALHGRLHDDALPAQRGRHAHEQAGGQGYRR